MFALVCVHCLSCFASAASVSDLRFIYVSLLLACLLEDVGGGQAGGPVGSHVPPSRGRVSLAAVLGAARGGVLPQERCPDRSAAAAGDVQGGGAAAYHGAGGGCCAVVLGGVDSPGSGAGGGTSLSCRSLCFSLGPVGVIVLSCLVVGCVVLVVLLTIPVVVLVVVLRCRGLFFSRARDVHRSGQVSGDPISETQPPFMLSFRVAVVLSLVTYALTYLFRSSAAVRVYPCGQSKVQQAHAIVARDLPPSCRP